MLDFVREIPERYKRNGIKHAEVIKDGMIIALFEFEVVCYVCTDFQVGVTVALAVIFMTFPDGMNTVTVVLNSGNSLKSAMRMLLLDAATPVLGAILSLYVAFLTDIWSICFHSLP